MFRDADPRAVLLHPYVGEAASAVEVLAILAFIRIISRRSLYSGPEKSLAIV